MEEELHDEVTGRKKKLPNPFNAKRIGKHDYDEILNPEMNSLPPEVPEDEEEDDYWDIDKEFTTPEEEE